MKAIPFLISITLANSFADTYPGWKRIGIGGFQGTVAQQLYSPAAKPLTAIAGSFSDAESGWQATPYGILTTRNGGKTWKLVARDLPISTFVAAQVINENLIYSLGIKEVAVTNTGKLIGGEYALMASTDKAESWKIIANFPEVIGGKKLKPEFGGNEDILGFHFISPTVGYFCGTNGLLLKTEDAGKSFSILNAITKDDIASIHSHDGTALLGVGNDVTFSLDGGTTWNLVPKLSGTFNGAQVRPDKSMHFVSGNGNYYSSKDLGQSWQGKATVNIGGNLVSLYFRNDLSLYAGGTGTSGTYVFKSIDGGMNWTYVNQGLGTVRAFHFLNEATGFHFGTAGIGLGGVSMTKDGGSTWAAMPDVHFAMGGGNIPSGALASMVRLGDKSFMAIGGKVTMFTQDNGNSWVGHPFSKINNQYLTAVAMQDAQKGFGIINGDIYRTEDSAKTWSEKAICCGTTSYSGLVFPSKAKGFANWSGGISRTDDEGGTWKHFKVDSLLGTGESVNGLAFKDDNKGFLFTERGNVLLTENGGENWKLKNLGATTNLNAAWIHTKDSMMIVGQSGVIRRSLDGGETWAPSISGTNVNLFSITCSPSAKCIAGGNQGLVLTSIDFGTTWKVSLNNLTPVFTGAMIADDTTAFVFGGNGAIFRTTNFGNEIEVPVAINSPRLKRAVTPFRHGKLGNYLVNGQRRAKNSAR